MQRLRRLTRGSPRGAAKLEGADRRSEWIRIDTRVRDGLQGCEEG
jgi:hypothetical protein